jgi:hypothetical protein
MATDAYGFPTKPSKFWTITNSQVYSTPGTYVWIAPNDASDIIVQIFGARGADGADSSCSNGEGYGGIGGRGGYGLVHYRVTPGNPYTIVIGAKPTKGSGSPGGSSSFAGPDVTTYTSTGGTPGTNATCNHLGEPQDGLPGNPGTSDAPYTTVDTTLAFNNNGVVKIIW